MIRPRLLDLFCGAGGAAVGYHRAGFDVVGVDIKPQPRYPFEFIEYDALRFLERADRWDVGWGLGPFDAIHASPPCQAFVQLARVNVKTEKAHMDLVAPTRSLLRAWGGPYVIENVVGSPLVSPIQLCGSSFGLGVRRHRRFESNMLLFGEPCRHVGHEHRGVYGDHPDGGRIWTRTGGGGVHRRAASIEEGRSRMGIDWMEWRELTQAIPPAYTEFIGQQLLEHLQPALQALEQTGDSE